MKWLLPGTILLAAGLWYVTFALEWGVFWYKIAASALLLTLITQADDPTPGWYRFSLRSVVIGVLSAAALYGIFMVGQSVSAQVFDFAPSQVGHIYGLGEGTQLWLIAAVLFFVTSPCEELYWRGWLQRELMERLGPTGGWLAGAAVYAGVHVWSMNLMLVGAALVAGLFWGWLYMTTRDLRPCIISHAVWSTTVFAILPLQ